jgi:hypothetical protein
VQKNTFNLINICFVKEKIIPLHRKNSLKWGKSQESACIFHFVGIFATKEDYYLLTKN